jgi:hypothetical protein
MKFDKKLLYEAFIKKGAVSVGRGMKTVGGVETEEGIVFGVPMKKDVPKSMAFSAAYDGYPSDVIETGIIRAQPVAVRQEKVQNVGRMRPAPGGCSIGHYAITAGTFGCVVRKGETRMILSNNHVLANSNDAEIRDPIYQPGPHDGGDSDDLLATLHSFIPIHFIGEESDCKFSKATAASLNALWSTPEKKLNKMGVPFRPRATRFMAVVPQAVDTNLVDAALAMPLSDDMISDEIIDIGMINGTAEGELGMSVQKSGRTTGYTVGVISQVLLAGAMSAGGDSGSAVLDMEKNLVGLLFAGSENTTLFSPIQNVFDALGVAL